MKFGLANSDQAARAEKRKKMEKHTIFGCSSGGGAPHVRSMAARAEGVAARAAQVRKKCSLHFTCLTPGYFRTYV